MSTKKVNTALARQKRINSYIKKMKEIIIPLIPEEKKEIAGGLIMNLSFMSITLDELMESVKNIGPMDEFKQGKQKFFRELPALKSYNTLIKNYNIALKQLSDLIVPGTNKKDALDEFNK